MRFLPFLLAVCLASLLTVGPGFAQTPPVGSSLGRSAPSTTAPPKPTPVVPAPKTPAAQKAPVKAKPPVKPGPKPPATPEPKPAPAPVAPPPAPVPPPEPTIGADTKLPLPRFMSFNNDPVNMRKGPKVSEDRDWVYHRRELPVQVIRELDGWMLVRDSDNIKGWVSSTALSPRRTFVVQGADRTLRAKADETSNAVALLKPGVVGRLRSCPSGSFWCEAEAGGYRGYLRRDEIWGVTGTEVFN